MELFASTDATIDYLSRALGLPCHFILETDHSPFKGGECFVVVVEDIKGRRFCVRSPVHVAEAKRRRLLEREIHHLKLSAAAGVRHLQRVIAFDLTSDNMLRAPHVVLNWIDGHELHWTAENPPKHQREKILKALAQTTLDFLGVSAQGKPRSQPSVLFYFENSS